MTHHSLTPITDTAASTDNPLATEHLISRARSYANQAEAVNTRRSHETSLRDFEAFCGQHGLQSFPAEPQTIALYATHLAASKRVSTVKVRLAAIASQHRRAGMDSPCSHRLVRDILRGASREKGVAPTRKSAITLDPLRQLLLAIHGDDVAARRDRAILLLGFAAALRRSELAALMVGDISFNRKGMLVRIVRSKTDQLGEGVELAVPFVANEALCAVRSVRAYLQLAGHKDGPLFRTLTFGRELTERPIGGKDVANLIQRLAKRARLEGDFSGHSLRAGFATAAAHAHASIDSIARTTRHKSLAVLMGYVRPAQAFDDVALTQVLDA